MGEPSFFSPVVVVVVLFSDGGIRNRRLVLVFMIAINVEVNSD